MINDYTYMYKNDKKINQALGPINGVLKQHNAKTMFTDSNTVFIQYAANNDAPTGHGLIFGEKEMPGIDTEPEEITLPLIAKNKDIILSISKSNQAPSGMVITPLAVTSTNQNESPSLKYDTAYVNGYCCGGAVAGFYNDNRNIDPIPGESFEYAFTCSTDYYSIDIGFMLSVIRAFSNLDFSMFDGEAKRLIKAWTHLMSYGERDTEDNDIIMLKSSYNEYGESVRKRVAIRNHFFPSDTDLSAGAVFAGNNDDEWSLSADDYSKLAVLDLVFSVMSMGAPIYTIDSSGKDLVGWAETYGELYNEYFNDMLNTKNRI